MKTIAQIRKMIAGVFIIIGASAIAQDQMTPSVNSTTYKNAVGLRAGETSGITFKHKFGNANAFEAIVSFWPYTIGATGLFEKNINLSVPGLDLYFGGGGHINAGSARYKAYYLYKHGEYVYVQRTGELTAGIDGIIGIEYKFKPVPIAVGFDLKPYVETSSFGYTYSTLDPGIGVKITF